MAMLMLSFGAAIGKGCEGVKWQSGRYGSEISVIVRHTEGKGVVER